MSLAMERIDPRVVTLGVSEDEQNMPVDRITTSHSSPNYVPAAWVIGMFLAGLGLWWGLFVIIIGNVLGSLPVALGGTMGPKTRLTQMEESRYAFGEKGKRLPAFINWVSCIGWDAVNNVPSVFAAVALAKLYGFTLEFWVGLVLLVALQVVVGVFGHHLVQWVEKYLGYCLLGVFAITGILSILNSGAVVTAPSQDVTVGLVLGGIAIVASFNAAWGPYSSDYTRYVNKNTSNGQIFWRILLGLVFSAGLIEFFGLMTAGAIVDATPQAVIDHIGPLTGAFAPLALLAIALSSIVVNAENDNTGAYSLISVGIDVPRPVSAVVAAGIAFFLALAGSGQFSELYNDYLLILLYWISPWIGIVLMHWYLSGQKLPKEFPLGWTRAATIFVVVTVVTIVLFASTPRYTGPVANMLGGTDIGYFVGFFAAAFLYAITRKQEAI